MKSLSHVRLFVTLRTVAYQAPPSMEFSRQEYWSGLPFPSPNYKVSTILKVPFVTIPFLVKLRVFWEDLQYRVEEPGGLQSMGSLRVRHD